MKSVESASVSSELRKGVITLAVLLQLRQENHGYALRNALKVAGIPLKEGTLYPLLRRLEAQGMLFGRWDCSGDRMRKYYSLTRSGNQVLEEMQDQWTDLMEIVRTLAVTSEQVEKACE